MTWTLRCNEMSAFGTNPASLLNIPNTIQSAPN